MKFGVGLHSCPGAGTNMNIFVFIIFVICLNSSYRNLNKYICLYISVQGVETNTNIFHFLKQITNIGQLWGLVEFIHTLILFFRHTPGGAGGKI